MFATLPVAGNNLEVKWMGRLVVFAILTTEEAVDCIRRTGCRVEQHAVSTIIPHAVDAGIGTRMSCRRPPCLSMQEDSKHSRLSLRSGMAADTIAV